MLAIRKEYTKCAVRWPTLTDHLVTTGLSSRVYETVPNPRDVVSSVYPTLCPPKGSDNFSVGSCIDVARYWSSDACQWVPDVAVARILLRETGIWPSGWYMFLPAVIATVVVVYVLERITHKMIKYWEKKVSHKFQRGLPLAVCMKDLALNTCDIPEGIDCKMESFEDVTQAMSPIQEILNPLSGYAAAKEQLRRERRMILEAEPLESSLRDKKSSEILALSEIMLTIDICPTLVSQGEEVAIEELSKLLERW